MTKGRRSEAEAVLDLLAGTLAENLEERKELLAAGSDGGQSSFGDIFSKGECESDGVGVELIRI
jgi:hypothetical protein